MKKLFMLLVLVCGIFVYGNAQKISDKKLEQKFNKYFKADIKIKEKISFYFYNEILMIDCTDIFKIKNCIEFSDCNESEKFKNEYSFTESWLGLTKEEKVEVLSKLLEDCNKVNELYREFDNLKKQYEKERKL